MSRDALDVLTKTSNTSMITMALPIMLTSGSRQRSMVNLLISEMAMQTSESMGLSAASKSFKRVALI